LKAEATHFAKKGGKATPSDEKSAETETTSKRHLESGDSDEEEDAEAKRRRIILEEAQELDADSAGESSEESSDSDEDDDDDEDETAELMRELEKIKKERAEQRAKEVRRPTFQREALAKCNIRKLKKLKRSKSSGNMISREATLCSIPKTLVLSDGKFSCTLQACHDS
jgi:protein CWC15